MKVINIVLEEEKDGMRFLLFNEKDQSEITTKKEQLWADQIEGAFKEFSDMLHELAKDKKDSNVS